MRLAGARGPAERAWRGAWGAAWRAAWRGTREFFAALPAGGALFLGSFVAAGLVGVVRGRGRDLNLWWIDLRDIPVPLEAGLLAAFAVAVLAWALVPRLGRRARVVTALVILAVALLAFRDAVRFWQILASGAAVRPMLPVPLSAVIAALLAALAVLVLRRPNPAWRPGRAGWAAVAFGAWAFVFPLAQMLFFGTTDYRRPADAAVVFGARVYADGRAVAPPREPDP